MKPIALGKKEIRGLELPGQGRGARSSGGDGADEPHGHHRIHLPRHPYPGRADHPFQNRAAPGGRQIKRRAHQLYQ